MPEFPDGSKDSLNYLAMRSLLIKSSSFSTASLPTLVEQSEIRVNTQLVMVGQKSHQQAKAGAIRM